MRKFLLPLLVLVFVACEPNNGTNTIRTTLSDISIECINETTISNNTSGNEPFTKHTYLCKGYVEGLKGIGQITVLHQNFILHQESIYNLDGGKMPFEFTFAPEWGYLDNDTNNFIFALDDKNGELLCSTTIVVTHND